MNDAMQFTNALIEYIERHLLQEAGVRIDADTRLFDDGLIDSLKILHLIAFVEKSVGRAIPENAIVMKNFRSVRAIADAFWIAPTRTDGGRTFRSGA